MFQHTAARRRLPKDGIFTATFEVVSTHSRPKAAANVKSITIRKWSGFNTQPPEGGCQSEIRGLMMAHDVSTHSRPKAAACVPSVYAISVFLFQHTAARRRLHHVFVVPDRIVMFQHTAARRRLHWLHGLADAWTCSFNTQPPEGGCRHQDLLLCFARVFQHTAARRRLPILKG